jgi:hypothetical protein
LAAPRCSSKYLHSAPVLHSAVCATPPGMNA